MDLHADAESADALLLQYLLDPGTKAEIAIKAFEVGAKAVGDIVEWVDKSSDKFAEVEEINKILGIIDNNRGMMVQMAES